MELLAFHTHVLEYMGNARWQFSTVEEYHERHAQQQRVKST